MRVGSAPSAGRGGGGTEGGESHWPIILPPPPTYLGLGWASKKDKMQQTSHLSKNSGNHWSGAQLGGWWEEVGHAGVAPGVLLGGTEKGFVVSEHLMEELCQGSANTGR